MKRPGDWLAWGAARLGWPGLTGLGLLVAAVLACLALVRPLEAQVQDLQAQVRIQASQPVAIAPVKLRDWRADLPAGHEAYGRLTRLFQAAEDAGLELDEGSYRSQSDTAAGITRLIINLPVSGEYPAIRAFIAQALNQDAALALENLRLSRDAMAETGLTADLRFALYLGGGQ